MASLLIAAAWVSLLAHAIALSWIDARTHRLPNRLLASCAIVGVTLLAASATLTRQPEALVRGVLVGCAAALAFGVVHMLGGMGMGDVKYSWILGFYLGTLGIAAAWWGLWWGFALAALVIVGGRLVTRSRTVGRIPFGPYMSAGALVGCVIVAMSG